MRKYRKPRSIEKQCSITIRITKKQMNRVETLAKDLETTRADVIRRAIREYRPNVD